MPELKQVEILANAYVRDVFDHDSASPFAQRNFPQPLQEKIAPNSTLLPEEHAR